MNKKKTFALQEEIIDIFKREKINPSEAIALIEVVKTNVFLNLLVGFIQKPKSKDSK
jgi:hypothetical protein